MPMAQFTFLFSASQNTSHKQGDALCAQSLIHLTSQAPGEFRANMNSALCATMFYVGLIDCLGGFVMIIIWVVFGLIAGLLVKWLLLPQS